MPATTNNGSVPDQSQAGTQARDFGDYVLERVLGEGGTGIVYQARQISLNRSVALKMFKGSGSSSGADLRRFRNEAEAMARLDHPNIVSIFALGQHDGQRYIIYELIAGESLDNRLQDYKGDPRRAAQLVATAAAAIHHSHGRGVLHGDLKPANILLDAHGEPHLTDFALPPRADQGSEPTHSVGIAGAAARVAPGRVNTARGAATITTATDVTALGAILYALLTGRMPSGTKSVVETLVPEVQGGPDTLGNLDPLLPRGLGVVCLKCLEQDPALRYASADALGDDLTRWLAGEPLSARPS
jgi:serine/threonine protein kinase